MGVVGDLVALDDDLIDRVGVLLARVGLVVGAEGAGLSRLVREKCDFVAKLPMPGGFESLNAGVAAALIMWEICKK